MQTLVPLAISLATLVIAQGSAAGQPRADSITDFVKVCVSALLTPEQLPAALRERGLAEIRADPNDSPPAPGWETKIYRSSNFERYVDVSHQHFSDLRITTCAAVVHMPGRARGGLSRSEFNGLRSTLEAHPRIGKLEGQTTPSPPDESRVSGAVLKRPGSAPIVMFNFAPFGTRSTSLRMSRWDR